MKEEGYYFDSVYKMFKSNIAYSIVIFFRQCWEEWGGYVLDCFISKAENKTILSLCRNKKEKME